jgi:hypothetical protein
VCAQLTEVRDDGQIIEAALKEARNLGRELGGARDMHALVEGRHWRAELRERVRGRRGGAPDVELDLVELLYNAGLHRCSGT